MSHLTPEKISLMEISNAKFRNGQWNILVMSPEKIGYKLFFDGAESDTDQEIKTKVIELLSEMEEKENAPLTNNNPHSNRETIQGTTLE